MKRLRSARLITQRAARPGPDQFLKRFSSGRRAANPPAGCEGRSEVAGSDCPRREPDDPSRSRLGSDASRTSTTAGPTRRAARGRRFRVNRFQRFREGGFYLLTVGRRVEWGGRQVPRRDIGVGPGRQKSPPRSDASRNILQSNHVPHEAPAGAAALSHKHRQHAHATSRPGPIAPGRRPCLRRAASRAGISNHQETGLQRCRKS